MKLFISAFAIWGIGVLALFGAFGAFRAEAQISPPPLLVGFQTVAVGEELPLPISVAAIPNGLSGYQLEISVSNSDLIAITSIGNTYAKIQGLEASNLNFATADLADIWPSGSAFPNLGDVTVRGLAPGVATLAVTVIGVDDEDGDAIELLDAETLILVQ